jgi:hypothetical protein
LLDVFGLRALVSTTEQQHDRQTDLTKIDSIARSVIDAEFLHLVTDAMTVHEIAQTHSIQLHANLCTNLDVA